MIPAPETYRVKKGEYATDDSMGNNGVFVIPHPRIKNYFFLCIISDGHDSTMWEHVSIVVKSHDIKVKRCPTWEEMCFVKDCFWHEEETVVQYHPPKSESVDNHQYCLHLFRHIDTEIMRPPSNMVGITGIDFKNLKKSIK